MASTAAWMACRAEESQACGKTRCWRAPPADAEMFNNTQPRISDTVQPLRSPRSEVSDNRNAATQPRSLVSRAGREGAEGLGTGPGNQARTAITGYRLAAQKPVPAVLFGYKASSANGSRKS